MSADEAMADALAAYVRDHHGGIVTSFVACLSYIDPDGVRCVVIAEHPHQTMPETMGLLRWHTLEIEGRVQDELFAEDDE